jgi:DNA-binding PadR family transcriptional regulator
MTPRFDPQPYLPLSPLAFHVLLALADGDKHGYAILRAVATLSDDRIRPSASTLYGVIERLEDDELIEESDVRPNPALDDARRRYYRLTTRGRAVGQAEADRLKALLDVTRRISFAAGHRRS